MKDKKVGPQGLIGDHCELNNTSLAPWTEVGPWNHLDNVEMGEYSYTGQFCIIQNARIGRFNNIAAMVRIGPTDHPLDRPVLHHFTYRCRMFDMAPEDDLEFFRHRQSRICHIGHDTWIGHGAIIKPELEIGNGAVVAAGAVVTKSVPAWAIVAGVPARIIRYRFAPEVCQALDRIAWWNWPRELLIQRLPQLRLGAAEFCNIFAPGSVPPRAMGEDTPLLGASDQEALQASREA